MITTAATAAAAMHNAPPAAASLRLGLRRRAPGWSMAIVLFLQRLTVPGAFERR
jgi:hypothetical protein